MAAEANNELGAPTHEPIVIVPLANPSGNESTPFLVNEPNEINIDGNHNDPRLSSQTTVINLNNNNVRITIWCIIYIVYTTLSMQVSSQQLIYIQDDEDWEHSDKAFWSFYQSSNSILWCAAVIILCNLYCTCCNCQCIKFSAFLFIIGGILLAVTMGDQLGDKSWMACTEDGWVIKNKEDEGYCKVSWLAAYLFPILFSFYMAVDAVTFIGNKIRTRIFVSAALIAIRSFLWFLIYRYQLQLIVNDDSNNAPKYGASTMISANFALFFWCLITMILLMIGYGDENNPNKKLRTFWRRVIGWFIIGATGGTMGFTDFANYWFLTNAWSTWSYYVPAACFLAYDIQYL